MFSPVLRLIFCYLKLSEIRRHMNIMDFFNNPVLAPWAFRRWIITDIKLYLWILAVCLMMSSSVLKRFQFDRP